MGSGWGAPGTLEVLVIFLKWGGGYMGDCALYLIFSK